MLLAKFGREKLFERNVILVSWFGQYLKAGRREKV
jgi:hypothetical protein